jgi:hypothetical protein
LLARLREIDWPRVRRAADLACGTGGGVWSEADLIHAKNRLA